MSEGVRKKVAGSEDDCQSGYIEVGDGVRIGYLTPAGGPRIVHVLDGSADHRSLYVAVERRGLKDIIRFDPPDKNKQRAPSALAYRDGRRPGQYPWWA